MSYSSNDNFLSYKNGMKSEVVGSRPTQYSV